MKKIIIVVLATLVSLTYSCSKAPISKKLKELKMNMREEPATMDPRKGGDPISSSMHFMLFEGLVILNRDCSTSPAQAERIEISDDRKTYTFHLRDSAWSDGSPMRAQDFEYSWKQILDPAFPAVNAHLLYPIKNAKAAKTGVLPLQEVGIVSKDDKTLVVTLEAPTPYFLQLISFCVFFPVHSEIDSAHPDWAFNASPHFVSNGPFVLKSWKHNDEVILDRNPLYWNKSEVEIDRIHLSMVADETTALQMFEKGQLDVIGAPLSPLPVEAMVDLAKKSLLQTEPLAGTAICAFNTQQFPFNNVKLRKAFSLAIHRQEIIDNITQMHEEVATGPVPPILKNRLNRQFFKDHAVNEARELFQEALRELGIQPRDLDKLTFIYTTSELNHKVAQALQQQWLHAFGIQVHLENNEHKVQMDRLSKRNFSFALTYWLAQYSDQMNILERYKFKENPKNYAAWEDPKFIALLDHSAFAPSHEDRMRILEEAEELFVNQMPVAPIYHMNGAFMVKPNIESFNSMPIGNMYYSRAKKILD